MTSKRMILLPIAILILGLVGTLALVRSRPPVETQPVEVLAPLVRVVEIEQRSVSLDVTAQGTVLPRTETTLMAQVAGEIVAVAPSFETGGFFRRGEVMVSLDRRDHEIALERAEARVAQNQLRVVLERAESQVAAEDWRDLGQGEADPLVLREPQLAEAEAAVAAAEADVKKARLDLERTRIRAPFDGRVRTKHVDLGQFVVPGQAIAGVHAIDYAEVRLPVPDDELAFVDLPFGFSDGPDGAGPPVQISARFAGRRHAWQGSIVRTEGELDATSRMLHLVARVEGPYRRGDDPERPPLAVGLFVDATIAGRTLADAVLLPRSALHEAGQVLVVDEDNRLRLRDVDVARVDSETMVLSGGLKEGERVCVSQLDVVVDGMEVRTVAAELGGELRSEEDR